MNWQLILAFPAAVAFTQPLAAETISGLVTDAATSAPIAGVRITLFSADLRFFREVRSAADSLGQAMLSETLASPYARRLFFRAQPSP